MDRKHRRFPRNLTEGAPPTYYFNARWYDPELGRFTTEDPVKDGGNWYAYVGNRPLVFTDPDGLAGTGDTRREDQRLLKEKEEKKEAYEDVEKRFEKWEDDTKPYERIVPENDPSRVLDNDLYWGDDFRTYLHSLSDADGKVIAELTNQELDDLYINYHQLRQASYEEVALPAQMMLLPAIGSAQAAMNLGMPLAKPIQPGYGKDIAAAKAAGRGELLLFLKGKQV